MTALRTRFRSSLTSLFSQLPTTIRSCPPSRLSIRRMASRPHSPPRKFPSSGFARFPPEDKIEEENFPGYVAERYYPVQLGEVFKSRYQVVAKLGYGISSTVWLCRDLHNHQYLTLKVCTSNTRQHNEITVSNHLQRSGIEHPGKKLVRIVSDSFDIIGPNNSKHKCLLYDPLGMSYTKFLDMLPEHTMPTDLVQRSIQLVLIGLAYLHDCNVIHTDISSNNILQGISDVSTLSDLEEGEMDLPIARKILPDRTIYNSRPIYINKGLPVLCDFGETRIGDYKHKGDIMPGIYRAPEVILDMEWDEKVDIWSIGVTVWDLYQGGHLFFAKKDNLLNDEQHLAEMVSLLGPPPLEFIKRSKKCLQFWDEGNWKCATPIPKQSWELRERRLEKGTDERDWFLHFLREIFKWLPEERPSAEDLARHQFLMLPYIVGEQAREQPAENETKTL